MSAPWARLASRALMGYAHIFMRRSLLKFGALAIVAICLGGHVTELFDHWEKAVISGNDVDYTCVFVAAVTGAVLVISGLLGKFFAAWPSPVAAPLTAYQFVALSAAQSVTSTHSPPLPLRI
jgi:hypothetical protein